MPALLGRVLRLAPGAFCFSHQWYIWHYSLKPYRVCPDCNAKYTTDWKSKRRQLPIVILALVALGLTAVVSIEGFGRLLPAVVSYIVLWVYVGYALSKVVYVRYPD